jgi:hypothetical protein
MFALGCKQLVYRQHYLVTFKKSHLLSSARPFSGKAHDFIYYGAKSANDFHSPEYEAFYQRSIHDKEQFWSDLAQDVHWHKPFDSVLDTSKEHFTRWFEGGQINIAYNCLDRHILEGKGNQTCFYEESAYTGHTKTWTYQEVYEQSGRLASVL